MTLLKGLQNLEHSEESLAIKSEIMSEYCGPRFRQRKMKEDSTCQEDTGFRIPVEIVEGRKG